MRIASRPAGTDGEVAQHPDQRAGEEGRMVHHAQLAQQVAALEGQRSLLAGGSGAVGLGPELGGDQDLAGEADVQRAQGAEDALHRGVVVPAAVLVQPDRGQPPVGGRHLGHLGRRVGGDEPGGVVAADEGHGPAHVGRLAGARRVGLVGDAPREHRRVVAVAQHRLAQHSQRPPLERSRAEQAAAQLERGHLLPEEDPVAVEGLQQGGVRRVVLAGQVHAQRAQPRDDRVAVLGPERGAAARDLLVEARPPQHQVASVQVEPGRAGRA